MQIKITKKGVKGAESLARGWIAPLYLNTSFCLLVTLTTLLSGSIGGLMEVREEQAVTPLPFKGLDLDESSLLGGSLATPTAK
ncbi:hypothetical protein DDW13_05920 [Acidianus hospitalis]|uniref:Uncharacterized protein n=1 Tax=Acidianus hospitalis TaxID=563177 RepID=A0A2T9X478_9CREN|nr:hypothetical protein DDW13_05920 [Acidianus hospitalis]